MNPINNPGLGGAVNKTSLYNHNPVRTTYLNYPNIVVIVAILASHIIPRILDPEGERSKRPPLQRYFTITLPDNALFAALILANNMPKLAALKDRSTLLATVFLTGGISKVIELIRVTLALGLDKVSKTQNFSVGEKIRDFAGFVGPRDFYAR